MTIHMKGGGWPDTANIYTYAVVYDNVYVGYACAFNSQGDITLRLPAIGAPGWRFIDPCPAITVGTFRIPQRTHAADSG